MQNGQPTASVSLPVAIASRKRFALTRSSTVLFFFPHLSAARAAAERVVAMARHLGHGAARVDERIARRVVHVIVAAQVARIVEGDVGRSSSSCS